MRFEMFTEHEVEIFAFHIYVYNLNELFLSICVQHTDKNVPRKCFVGAFFYTLYCRIAGTSGGFAPWTPTRALLPGPPPGLCPGSTGRLQHPLNTLLFQAMTYGHCISCFRQDTTFIHALMTNLAHHSKSLKKAWLECVTNSTHSNINATEVALFQNKATKLHANLTLPFQLFRTPLPAISLRKME